MIKIKVSEQGSLCFVNKWSEFIQKYAFLTIDYFLSITCQISENK